MQKEQAKYDEVDDILTINKVEDVTSVIEANKRAFINDDGMHKQEAMNHVARIPLSLLESWAQQHGVSYNTLMRDERLFKRFLNDPDNKFIRTKPGII